MGKLIDISQLRCALGLDFDGLASMAAVPVDLVRRLEDGADPAGMDADADDRVALVLGTDRASLVDQWRLLHDILIV